MFFVGVNGGLWEAVHMGQTSSEILSVYVVVHSVKMFL